MRCALTLIAIGALAALVYAEEPAKAVEDADDLILRQGRARGRSEAVEEKGSAITSPEELAKYSSFIDVLLRRVGVQFRTRSDPLSIKLERQSKNSPKKSKKSGKSGIEKKKSSSKNAGKKSPSKKSRSKKQGRRHPKDLNVEEEIVSSPAEAEEEHVEERQKRDIAFDDEEEDIEEPVIELEAEDFDALFASVRVERDLEELEDNDDEEDFEEDDDQEALERVERDAGEEPAGEEVNRRGEAAAAGSTGRSKKGRAQKSPKSQKSANKGKKSKKGGKSPNRNSGRKNNNSNNKKSKKSGKSSRGKKSAGKKNERVPRATVNGFGSLSRFGDVAIKSHKEKRSIIANFKSGPVVVRVSQAGGPDDSKKDRTAKASTTTVTGNIAIDIDNKGNAKIARLRLFTPENVLVEGAIGNQKHSDKVMQRSFKIINPVVAKKMKFAARDVLKESSKKMKA